MISAQSNAVAQSGGMYTRANSPLAQLGTLSGIESAIQAAYARPARSGTLNGLLEATKQAYSRPASPGTLNSLTESVMDRGRLDLRA